jgi:hypothetical protein
MRAQEPASRAGLVFSRGWIHRLVVIRARMRRERSWRPFVSRTGAYEARWADRRTSRGCERAAALVSDVREMPHVGALQPHSSPVVGVAALDVIERLFLEALRDPRA